MKELQDTVKHMNTQMVMLRGQVEDEKHRKVTSPVVHDEELNRLKVEEDKMRKEVMDMTNGMNCEIRVLTDNQYAVMVKRKKQMLARIEVKFIPLKRILLKVALHPSVLKIDQQRLEMRLPIKNEWEIDVKDIKEMILRCYWILIHSL